MNIPNNLKPMLKNDDSYEEIWVKQQPKYADHIRVWRNTLYTHHGIFVSNNEIVHFVSKNGDNLTGSDNEIHKTDLRSFLRGGILEVKVYNSEELAQLKPPDVIVKTARSLVRDDGYNLVFNNCEHFANYCTFGEHRSHQLEKVIIPIPQKVFKSNEEICKKNGSIDFKKLFNLNANMLSVIEKVLESRICVFKWIFILSITEVMFSKFSE